MELKPVYLDAVSDKIIRKLQVKTLGTCMSVFPEYLKLCRCLHISCHTSLRNLYIHGKLLAGGCHRTAWSCLLHQTKECQTRVCDLEHPLEVSLSLELAFSFSSSLSTVLQHLLQLSLLTFSLCVCLPYAFLPCVFHLWASLLF